MVRWCCLLILDPLHILSFQICLSWRLDFTSCQFVICLSRPVIYFQYLNFQQKENIIGKIFKQNLCRQTSCRPESIVMDKESDEADAQKIQVGKRSAIASLRNSLNLPEENRFEGKSNSTTFRFQMFWLRGHLQIQHYT